MPALIHRPRHELLASAARAWAARLAVALLVVGWSLALAQDGGDTDFAFAQKPGSALPPGLHLREADGRDQALDPLFGRAPVILALGYFHCPTLCGIVRNDLLEALSRSGLRTPEDYALLAVSIDPAEKSTDAAAALAADRDHYPTAGSERGWHYMTGEPVDVAALAASVGFRSRYDAHLRQFLHPAGIVVFTPDRRVSSYVLGVGYAPGDLAAAVTLARSGLLSSVVSPILLLCFNHDATTGRYSLAVIKVLRLAAILTIVGIGGMLILIRRRARHGKAVF